MTFLSVKDYLSKNNIEFSLDQPMDKRTSFHIGGNAALLACPKTGEELGKLLAFLKNEKIPYMFLGKGSNLLVSDRGIDEVVISFEKMSGITVQEQTVTAQAGVSLQKLCVTAMNQGLEGLTFAYGIPGSVGGAVFMNAGAYGGEIANVIEKCRCVTPAGEIITLTNCQMELGYRTSIFKTNGYAVIDATFRLKRGDKEVIKAQMEDIMNRRRQKQPLEYPSAGSTFKRPLGYFAGALIEECGLKGASVGDAQVSEKHAGFVINKGKATCSDVTALIKKIQDTVLDKKGIKLETEVIFVGSE